ncbi:tRNA (adenosine(37)-N6)-threonylcarbamoyltransferase complex transferase subunit TsaD [candidate division KSB1 bacterium]|nr:tRNA (adenosine(37)-N6)-threonylcarbamoyltransferase complex transferase subunit TsaD [candidate division KSB1 bacterium]
MIILGIETSCDETSVALVNDLKIISNIISTQKIHEQYGGVVPEFASRAHMTQLLPIVREAFREAQLTFKDIDGLAVTCGPGLAGSLLVGMCFCKGLAASLKKPFIGINHIEGHILAVNAQGLPVEYPAICLVVSGGHTLLIYIKEPTKYKIIGRTIDDAAGEAFDKTAKILGLGYPGGPAIEKNAKTGNEKAIAFPRALMDNDNFNFSFSGLKTSVLYYVESLKKNNREIVIPDICASFQKAVSDVLVEKSIRALQEFKCNTLILAGGVARNSTLRECFEKQCEKYQKNFFVPAPELCTDNAAMIAKAGHIRLQKGEYSDFSLDVVPNLSLSDSF